MIIAIAEACAKRYHRDGLTEEEQPMLPGARGERGHL